MKFFETQNITLDAVVEGFIDVLRYSSRYFDHITVDPSVLFSSLWQIKNEGTKLNWNGIFLIFEICFCAPFSNAEVERFSAR